MAEFGSQLSFRLEPVTRSWGVGPAQMACERDDEVRLPGAVMDARFTAGRAPCAGSLSALTYLSFLLIRH